MRISKLVIGVFTAVLFTFSVASPRVSVNSSAAAGLKSQSQASNILIADGSDPLPRPWKSIAA
ncbi:MAG: hypothetical protein M3P45_02005 [Acidobacteriota bacterium]|nr:hypothetical protein [Acidobacteriota bacterium]